MIVLDAGILIDAITDGPRSEAVRQLLALDPVMCAPELILTESLATLWKLRRREALSDGDADRAVELLGSFHIELVSHRLLTADAWVFRRHTQITDAYYLACAGRLGVTLVTTDGALARGHHGVSITLVN